MTVVQCSYPIAKTGILNIMKNEFGSYICSVEGQYDELLSKMLSANYTVIDHIMKNIGHDADSIPGFLPGALYAEIKTTMVGGVKQQNGALCKTENNLTILDYIQYRLKNNRYIKYVPNNYEFKDILCETLCYQINAFNDILKRKITYNELHDVFHTIMSSNVTSKIFIIEFTNYLLANHNILGIASQELHTSSKRNDPAITKVYDIIYNFFNTYIDFSSVIDSTNNEYTNIMKEVIRNRIAPIVRGYTINAMNIAFDNGAVGSKKNINFNNTIFDTNNADVIIKGSNGDYKINGKVILAIQAIDYNEKYNIMRWCDGLAENNNRIYLFEDKIARHIRANAERYTNSVIERVRKELTEIYHKSYSDDEIRRILFSDKMRSLYSDNYIPLRYADENTHMYHIKCDGNTCPNASHGHEGEIKCTRCKYMRLKYDQMNVYVMVYPTVPYAPNPVTPAYTASLNDYNASLPQHLEDPVRNVMLYADNPW